MTRVSGRPITLEPAWRVALLGQRVAFVGRLGTMTRTQAEALVSRAAGRPTASVMPRATMLVVGMRGWPLMESGQLPSKLIDAEALQASGKPMRILSELAFRQMLGLEAAPDGKDTGKSLSGAQVCKALNIEGRTLQRWEHCGLVRPFGGKYDFRDLVSLRTVSGLVARGVSALVIRESLDALGRFLPGVERPLAQLNILVSDSGELAAQVEEALLTPSGQLEMCFDAPVSKGDARLGGAGLDVLPMRDERGIAAWIDQGLEHEEAGNLSGAQEAYRRAAAAAPCNPMPLFNLGNVLLAAGQLEAARERFASAVTLDPGHARAWFNLAHVNDALGDHAAAIQQLRRAIVADPAYADAYFNLADLCERRNDGAGAMAAWLSYLRLDPASQWSAHARRRLERLRRGMGRANEGTRRRDRGGGGPAWA